MILLANPKVLLVFSIVALTFVKAMTDDEIDKFCATRKDVHCEWCCSTHDLAAARS